MCYLAGVLGGVFRRSFLVQIFLGEIFFRVEFENRTERKDIARDIARMD